jgi:type IV pilus assembly protein PilE
MDREASAGFSLTELLITIAIIAILGAAALPSYIDYARRGKIAEPTGNLAVLRVKLEQYYQDHRSYGAQGVCGVAMPPSQYFSYACMSSGSDQQFLLVATGSAARGMAGFVYTIDQDGLRRTTGLPADWGATPYDCWITSKGGAC